jgi:hypothetical protein
MKTIVWRSQRSQVTASRTVGIRKRTWLLQLLTMLCCAPMASAQGGNVLNMENPPPLFGNIHRRFAVEAMDSVFKWIEQRQPAPYQYLSRAEVRRRRSALAQSLPDSVDRWWFVDQLAQVVSAMDNEAVWIYNASSVRRTDSPTGPPSLPRFPAFLQWVEDRAIVTFGKRGLWDGDEVLRINGVGIDSLVRHTAHTLTGTRTHRLELATALIPVEMHKHEALTEPYVVDVRRYNGERATLRVSSSTLDEVRHSNGLMQANNEMLGIGVYVGHLRNGAFTTGVGGLQLVPQKTSTYLRQIAEKLVQQQSPALVIDLRWESNLPPWLIRTVVNALKPAGILGRTNVPTCVLMGGMTTHGAAQLVSEIQRLGLARTLGEDAGGWHNGLAADLGTPVPHLSAILMLPERGQTFVPGVRRTLHPLIHVPVWRKDIAEGRSLAMELASECGSLKPVPRVTAR